MKVIRIDDVDKINFDSIKAEFKTSFSKVAQFDVREISTLKDSCFLNLLLEVWKKTPYEEVVKKLSDSKNFNNYKREKENE